MVIARYAACSGSRAKFRIAYSFIFCRVSALRGGTYWSRKKKKKLLTFNPVNVTCAMHRRRVIPGGDDNNHTCNVVYTVLTIPSKSSRPIVSCRHSIFRTHFVIIHVVRVPYNTVRVYCSIDKCFDRTFPPLKRSKRFVSGVDRWTVTPSERHADETKGDRGTSRRGVRFRFDRCGVYPKRPDVIIIYRRRNRETADKLLLPDDT